MGVVKRRRENYLEAFGELRIFERGRERLVAYGRPDNAVEVVSGSGSNFLCYGSKVLPGKQGPINRADLLPFFGDTIYKGFLIQSQKFIDARCAFPNFG